MKFFARRKMVGESLQVARAQEATNVLPMGAFEFGSALFRVALGYAIFCVGVGAAGIWLCQAAFDDGVAGSVGLFLSPAVQANVWAQAWCVLAVVLLASGVCLGLVRTANRARQRGHAVPLIDGVYFLAIAGPIVGLFIFGAGLLIHSSSITMNWI